MFNIFTKLFFIIISTLYLHAYELPKVDLKEDRAEIVLFKAESIMVGDEPSFRVTWKTINATDVNVTFFGKIALEGSITVTEDEFNYGVITMMAWNKKSKYVDVKKLNNYRKGKAMPILQDRTPVDDGYYGDTMMPYRAINPRAVHRRPHYR